MEVKPQFFDIYAKSFALHDLVIIRHMGASTIEDQSKGQIEAVKTQPGSVT